MKKSQNGAVLLVLLGLMMLTGATLMVNRLDVNTTSLARVQQTSGALQQAREALLGFALAYGEQHPGQPQGYLPCPDKDGDGTADGPCGVAGQSVIGRLPWRTLNLPPLRDGAGECLWYAVSGRYKNDPKLPLTSDSDGMFLVKNRFDRIEIGGMAHDRAIALVLSAGSILGHQDRRLSRAGYTECGSTVETDAGNNAANYLDLLSGVNNATGQDVSAAVEQAGGEPMPRPLFTDLDSVFIAAPQQRDADGNVVFNDTLMSIKPSDYARVYRRMDGWVARRVSACLKDYALANNGTLPFAASVSGEGLPDYDDDAGVQFGRIADAPFDDSLSIESGLLPAWQADPLRPAEITGVDCFDGSPAPDPNWAWWWWPAWKELVFIGIDVQNLPGRPVGEAAAPMLDQVPQQAVVLVAGRRLAGQHRDSNRNKAQIANYLEQTSSILHTLQFISAPAGPAFNDVALPVFLQPGSES